MSQFTKDRNSLNLVKKSLEKVAHRQLPRILTQFCRDPNNSAFGCADRNWWHYKIRDFPSIILQQAALTIQIANNLEIKNAIGLNKLIEGSVYFWNKRVLQYGAFEEYYPWEKGFPPLAFSTLAIMLVIKNSDINPEIAKKGASKAANQLLKRFEPQAANQQLAALAALAHIKNIYPDLVSNQKFQKLSQKTLSLQNSEGWFNEYGGPDLGYLSVSIDCLWDLFDATKDQKYIDSASRSLIFISSLINWSKGHNIGPHNSRNTDYLVPYGISRFLESDNKCFDLALNTLNKLYSQADDENHFFSSIDDRYWCHYIGASVFRSLLYMPNQINKKIKIKRKNSFEYFLKSGLIFVKKKDINILISTKKGGIFSIFFKNSVISDFGWHLQYKDKELVNNFWSKEWKCNYKKYKNRIEINIDGKLVNHQEININPLNHFLLRICSLLFGNLIIDFLKKKLIFKKGLNNSHFFRNIKIYGDIIIVNDKITNNNYGNLTRAPRASKRHVSSSDNFHKEDFIFNNFYSDKKYISNNEKEITTQYLLMKEQ